MASETFTKQVQTWVEIDNEIKIHERAKKDIDEQCKQKVKQLSEPHDKEIKKLSENKNKISIDVMKHMQHNSQFPQFFLQ